MSENEASKMFTSLSSHALQGVCKPGDWDGMEDIFKLRWLISEGLAVNFVEASALLFSCGEWADPVCSLVVYEGEMAAERASSRLRPNTRTFKRRRPRALENTVARTPEYWWQKY
ncbi:MAG: hypothetical protein QM496_13815 [Verrucomicrobiota bacterium]